MKNLKHLTIAACVAALLPACVIGNDDSASDSNSNATTNPNGDTTADGGTTEAPTTANPTTGTTGATTGQTTGMTSGTTGDEDTTSDVPTTDGTTNATTGMTTGMTSGSTGETTGMTTGMTTGETGGVVGCGWAEAGYYACSDMDGVPDAEDPMMTDPIDCPAGLVAGDACDDMMGPVNNVGCCAPEGNYFCDNGKIFFDDCGD